jgi:hypothetical protein
MAQVSSALRWGGRLLAVGGVVLGLLPNGSCGSAFFPDAQVDVSGVACSDVTSGRMTAGVVLLVVGVAVMIAGQVIGWRGQTARGGRP